MDTEAIRSNYKSNNQHIEILLGELIEAQIDDDSQPLHGYFDQRGLGHGQEFVSFPYGELAHRISVMHANTKRANIEFRKGYFPLNNILGHLIRSLQFIGIHGAKIRAGYRGEVPGPTAHLDLSMSLDMTLYYMRVIADYVAKTVPSLVLNDPCRSRVRSIRKQWKAALESGPRDPLFDVYNGQSDQWLQFLAGRQNDDREDGARNARTHDGALHAMNLIGMSSPLDDRLDLRIRTVSPLGVHSQHTIRETRKACQDFFKFLDHIVRVAARKETVPPLTSQTYSQWGVSVFWPPEDFVSMVLPTVRPTS